KNSLPASVSSTPWAKRRNSAAPTSPSRSLICWLSGGWPMPTLAAALVKCRSSATARKYRMWRSSMAISKTDHTWHYHILDKCGAQFQVFGQDSPSYVERPIARVTQEDLMITEDDVRKIFTGLEHGDGAGFF